MAAPSLSRGMLAPKSVRGQKGGHTVQSASQA